MNPEMYQKVVEENAKLKQELNKKDNEISNLKVTVENQKQQIEWFNRYVFGAKRESTPKEDNIVEGTQCSIFGEPEDEELKEEIEKATEEIIVHKKKNKKKEKAGIKRSALKNVETETIECIVNEDEKCPECNSELENIGQELVRQEIKFIPAKLVKVNYVRKIYKCKKCGSEESEKETPTIIKAKTPTALLPRSFVSPSLATDVIYQKYYMGVPLYRQEKVWDDRGLVLPRNVSANWCIRLSEYYLEPICEAIKNTIKAKSQVLHCDETKMQCNKEPGKKASSDSFMWVLATGEEEKRKAVIYTYSESRKSEVAQELLKGYSGILVTDGYSGYNILEDQLNRTECWAHARRYFYESVPLDENKKMITSSDGYTGLKYIDRLFEVEREIAKLDNEEKVAVRKEKSAPIVEEFYKWVYSTSQKYITNKKLRKALTYAENQKKNLIKYIEDGRIPMSNSLAERAIRPFAIHRKNWLFADSVAGANANATYYSIIESAKINKLNIYKYIEYLLTELPQQEHSLDDKEIEKYMPWSEELPPDVRNYEGEYEALQL